MDRMSLIKLGVCVCVLMFSLSLHLGEGAHRPVGVHVPGYHGNIHQPTVLDMSHCAFLCVLHKGIHCCSSNFTLTCMCHTTSIFLRRSCQQTAMWSRQHNFYLLNSLPKTGLAYTQTILGLICSSWGKKPTTPNFRPTIELCTYSILVGFILPV